MKKLLDLDPTVIEVFEKEAKKQNRSVKAQLEHELSMLSLTVPLREITFDMFKPKKK